MPENSFASFKPIISFDDNNKERLQNYYAANGLSPDNDYMKNYLGLNNPADTPIMKSTSTTKENVDISKILADVVLPVNLSEKVATAQSDAIKPQVKVPIAPQSKDKEVVVQIPKSKKDFIKTYLKAAEKASATTHIPTDMLLGQIALESGWGQHAPGYNLGGIKADNSWKGRVKTNMTLEQGKTGLYTTRQNFRAYGSAEEGFQDYVDFLTKNKRYQPLVGVKDPYKAAEIMGRSGYATDANYAKKLKDAIKSVQKTKSELS